MLCSLRFKKQQCLSALPLESNRSKASKSLLSIGIHRFLNRFHDRMWNIGKKPHRNEALEELLDSKRAKELYRLLHQTIKKVSQDTESLECNTAISQMMILGNSLSGLHFCPLEVWRPFGLLLSPYAPHLGEELWQAAKPADREGTSLTYEAWPTWDEALCQGKAKRDDRQKSLCVAWNGLFGGSQLCQSAQLAFSPL